MGQLGAGHSQFWNGDVHLRELVAVKVLVPLLTTNSGSTLPLVTDVTL